MERLSWKAPFTKRAPRHPAAILVRFERIVRNRVVPVGWRIWAWAKLVKTWASLRWSDLQAMTQEISALPLTLLRRAKTTGATRRIKELLVYVWEKAFFEDPSWLAEVRAPQAVGRLQARVPPTPDQGRRHPGEEDG